MHMLSKRFVAMALTLLMLLTGISAFAAGNSVELDAVNAEYLPSDIVIIKGNTDLPLLTLTLVNPRGGVSYIRNISKDDLSSGIYLQIPEDAILGTYTIRVENAAYNVKSELTFEVKEEIEERVVLEGLKQDYLRGEVITVKGRSEFPLLVLNIINSKGTSVYFRNIKDTDLASGINIVADGNLVVGEYTLVVGYGTYRVAKKINIYQKKLASVETFETTLPAGTTLEDMIAALPSELDATFYEIVDGEGQESAGKVNVGEWSLVGDFEEGAEAYEFEADIVQEAGVLYGDLTKAQAVVTLVESGIEVDYIEEVQLTAPVGTSLEDVISMLPDKVTAVLVNEETVELEVEGWELAEGEEYDANTPGEYTFVAPVKEKEGVVLGENTTATAKVTLIELEVVAIEEIETLILPVGTTLETVISKLPTRINATLNTDEVVVLELENWQCPNYDKNKAGEYKFTATVKEVEGIKLGEFTQAQAVVTLVESGIEVDYIEEVQLTAPVGTSLEDVISMLPDKVTAVLVNEETVELEVEGWELAEGEEYDANTPGEYTFVAPVKEKEGVVLGENTTATAKVTLIELEVVAIEEIETLILPVGTTLETVISKLPTRINATLNTDEVVVLELENWQCPNYDKNKAGEYKFTATVKEVEGIKLGEFTQVEATVILQKASGKVAEIETIYRIAQVGATLEDILGILPNKVNAKLESGETIQLVVGDWTSEDFEEGKEGTFTFEAPVSEIPGVELGDNTKATAYVVIASQFKVIAVEELEDYYPVEKGKSVEYVKNNVLPQSIKVTVVNANSENNDDAVEIDVDVEWREANKWQPSYTKDTQTFVGTLKYPDYVVAGKAFETVRAYVWVEVPLQSVSVSSSMTVYVNSTKAITVKYTPNDASKVSVTYTSRNPSIATVNSKGEVRGVKAGTANIDVVVKDNTKLGGETFTKTVKVTVKSATSAGGGGDSGRPYIDLTDGGISRKAQFKDLATVPWAQDAITKLYEAGVIEGRTAEVFDPNSLVTRAEFLTMLTKAVGVYNQNATTDKFSDVRPGAWYMSYIASAVAAGIVQGYEDGTFRPDQNITRQEMAVMVYRAAKVTGIQLTAIRAQDVFTDDGQIADWAKEAVYEMQKAGIINGMGDGTFAPLQNATRAQAAVMIYGVYSKKQK